MTIVFFIILAQFLFFVACFVYVLFVRYYDGIGLEDAISMALLTLKENFDGDITNKNIQVGVVRQNTKTNEWKFSILSPAELQDYLDTVHM